LERLGADQDARAAVRAQLADELAAALGVAVEDEHVGQLEVLVELGGAWPVGLPHLVHLIERGQAGHESSPIDRMWIDDVDAHRAPTAPFAKGSRAALEARLLPVRAGRWGTRP